MRTWPVVVLTLAVASPLAGAPPIDPAEPADTLEKQLLRENAVDLARSAREQGDAVRGAILFYQPTLACAKCHTAREKIGLLGPDLATSTKEATGAYLVESILAPSREIKKGFETVTLVTTQGITVIGLLAEERVDAIVLRDPAQDGKLITIARKDIEERSNGKVSLMPAGLVNYLGDRQQFLDLVRYLLEIAEKGPARALELRPAPSLYALPPLPEYERTIDHSGMIRTLDAASFKRGEAIYNRLCINCHGTKDRPGSLPTSLPFASGKFKNGSDPFGMYQTLTHGFGLMTPQTWMVPEQKYDVIHYIRETFLKDHNPTQYARIDATYLDRLPRGSSRGPKPSNIDPWVSMDYGPNLIATYEIGTGGSNFAYKGIAVRLDAGPGGVSRGRSWLVFDHDTLRVGAGWSGQGFIDWKGINFDGRHEVHPSLVGRIAFANPIGPGWANPDTGSFDDPRLRGRDGRPYGPLPRGWAHYKGLYHFGNQVIVSCTVGDVSVLEMPGHATTPSGSLFTRTFNIGPRSKDMVLQVAYHPAAKSVLRLLNQPSSHVPIALFGPEEGMLVTGLSHQTRGMQWLATENGHLRLRIPAGKERLHFTLWLSQLEQPSQLNALVSSLETSGWGMDLEPLTRGGPPRWATHIKTQPRLGTEEGPFAVDVLTHPTPNPWLCQMRLTGFDFFGDGKRAAVCSWDGDVWLVRGLDTPQAGLTWQRIASGLFQPLGLKIIKDRIFVGCRDQIVLLHDLNGDGEIDFYENFNSDHQVTEHFHEFAMDLQTDDAGNFYYTKGARHAKTALVPQHGTLLRVGADGLRTDILATGFRAANGVCLNPDGSFFVTDQEGHWLPKNRINWVTPGRFYGNMWGYHDVTDSSDSAMEQPLCWITNKFDRSPAEMLWVESKAWGSLNGSLLNLSYGQGKIFVVPHEKVNGQMQGGMCPLPLPLFPTGVMRGRFHPGDGQLYTCGMYAWAGNQQQPGGLFRVRATGKPMNLPIGLSARRQGIALTFSDPINPVAAEDARNYAIKTWSLKRTANYGSNHYNEKRLAITSAKVSSDGRTVFLEVPDTKPTWCMEIKYSLKDRDGKAVESVIHNTIHHLRQ